jgi:uncharacterized peroxidase-related enzyme
MFVADPPDDPDVAALYDAAFAEDGYVMNLLRAWAWRPAVHEAFLAARSMLRKQTTLTSREIAVLNVAAASARGNAYCAIAWGTILSTLSDSSTAAALVRGDETPALTERERILAHWAPLVARDPNAITRQDVEGLRDAGLSEQEIVDATLFVAFRVAFTTVNDALGAQPDHQLVEEAPATLLASITFGRAVGRRS